MTLAKTFADVIPAFGSSKNPIDLSGQAPVSYYDSALTAALNSKDIHSVICLACETAVFDPDGFSQSGLQAGPGLCIRRNRWSFPFSAEPR